MVTKTNKRFPWGERVATPEMIDEYVRGITGYTTGDKETDKAARDITSAWLKNYVNAIEHAFKGEHRTMEDVAGMAMDFLQGFNAGAGYISEEISKMLRRSLPNTSKKAGL